jgi:MFS transporter, FHS family, L-fucose permease
MTQTKTLGRRDNVVSITLIGVLFFIFGFVTWLNGTLIPFLKISCELNNMQAYLVTFAFYISYFVMALPSSWVLKKTHFKGGMALGLMIMAVGTLFFLPAAWNRTYWLFLAGLFIQGTGLAVLQTASNPYIAILGPIESAARRISIMGICNKIAGVISPIILGAIVLRDTDSIKAKIDATVDLTTKALLLDEMASRVIMPYIVMTIILVILAVLVRFSPLPDIDRELEEPIQSINNSAKKSIFQFPHLLLGFVAIFVYVGAEVIAGDTIILYGHSQGIPMVEAKIFTSYTLVAMVLGYILGIVLIPKVITQEKALGVSALLGIAFSFAALIFKGYASVMFIAVLGFANAIMWPAIWPLAINGLGKFTKTGSAILIMGIAGGATLPLIYGKLTDISFIGSQQAYWILVPCYIYIMYYAYSGHKAGRRTNSIAA